MYALISHILMQRLERIPGLSCDLYLRQGEYDITESPIPFAHVISDDSMPFIMRCYYV